MSDCCTPRGYERLFSERGARAAARRYRAKGLDTTSRRILALLRRRDLAGDTLLEIGGGIGDLGAALKLRSDVSPRAAVAIVSSVTAPTGDAAKGIGAGRALGGLTAVFSVDLPGGVHADANAGPQGIGEGRPQWFTSLALAHSFGGRLGATLEAFNFTAGGAGPQFSGILGAVTIRLAAWAIADAGGERRLSSGSLSQIFLGLTTNIGRVF